MKEMTTTSQQLGRTEMRSTVETDSAKGPSKQWRAAFGAQLTPDLMDDVTAYAASRARWMEQHLGRRQPGTVEEMVQDAIGDTFAGVLSWDPERFPLNLHLKTAIRSRLSHELERMEDFRHVDVADTSEDELSDAMRVTATPTASTDLDRHAEAFERWVRENVRNDEPVLRLVECYCEGITERREACRVTGMTSTIYHNAHRRLKRLIERLPANLRVSALTALT